MVDICIGRYLYRVMSIQPRRLIGIDSSSPRSSVRQATATCRTSTAMNDRRTDVRNWWPHDSQCHQWRTTSSFTCCERAGATMTSSQRGQNERANMFVRAENGGDVAGD